MSELLKPVTITVEKIDDGLTLATPYPNISALELFLRSKADLSRAATPDPLGLLQLYRERFVLFEKLTQPIKPFLQLPRLTQFSSDDTANIGYQRTIDALLMWVGEEFAPEIIEWRKEVQATLEKQAKTNPSD